MHFLVHIKIKMPNIQPKRYCRIHLELRDIGSGDSTLRVTGIQRPKGDHLEEVYIEKCDQHRILCLSGDDMPAKKTRKKDSWSKSKANTVPGETAFQSRGRAQVASVDMGLCSGP